MSDLRSELLGRRGATIPPYRMLLPPGWDAYDLSEQTEKELVKRATTRLRAAQATEALTLNLSRQVRDALASVRAQNGFVYAFAGESAPTWALGSASLIGIKRAATPEAPLGRVVENVIANQGGVAVGEGHRIVRWTERRPVSMDDVDAVSFMINYLIPIPGSKLTEAVQWTVTVAHEADLPEDDPVLELWVALFDAHIATFTWEA
ncbi:hypothetical protein CQ047_07640 [Microbacterium sp. MYb72]|uniref:hypothetical protein n=1 Tax=Microbacterium sp. MYb72 TaxID=1848693 RepID=UPI000CFC4A74|nr:hypothetical protein [Microbacterium sp. MYb72]PRB10338.1 hypothetical protein CQ047_07640 [Microbacterium sp. MYb72]